MLTAPILHNPHKDSPSTFLVSAIDENASEIIVSDAIIFQNPYNTITRLTLGFDTAITETVEVSGYNGNRITIIRGSNGQIKYPWQSGTRVARVLTSYDIIDYIKYFNYLKTKLLHTEDSLNELIQRVNTEITDIIELNNSWSGKRNLFRGYYLGDTITQAQSEAIDDGTFNNLYLGDYWTFEGINYRIADFNYWTYGLGGGNHLVIVPDQQLAIQPMDPSVNSVPYYNAAIRLYLTTTILPNLQRLFGNRIGFYYENLYTESSQYNEVLARVELMNELMVYGKGIHRKNREPTYSFNQLALFRSAPEFINTDGYTPYWLRDQSAGEDYCSVSGDGMADYNPNDNMHGIRPCFPLLGEAIMP